MTEQQFGGGWTELKLAVLGEYLREYRRIFEKNEKVQFFKTIHVDAFAGTGQRRARTTEYPENLDLFGESEDQDRSSYKRGSVEVALGIESPFDQYVFVEINTSKARQLRQLIADKYSHLEQRCAIEQADANAFLQQWCTATNWKKHRAVVFLDPFGMSVEWKTIEAIAKTRAIDMWTLFPIGAGVNRVLTKEHRPPQEWEEAITIDRVAAILRDDGLPAGMCRSLSQGLPRF